jgi:hypothetical protein
MLSCRKGAGSMIPSIEKEYRSLIAKLYQNEGEEEKDRREPVFPRIWRILD